MVTDGCLLSSHEVNKGLSFLVGQHRRDSLLPYLDVNGGEGTSLKDQPEKKLLMKQRPAIDR